jgi:hypothetical protein
MVAADDAADPALQHFHERWKAALALRLEWSADLILISKRNGMAVAPQKGSDIIGTEAFSSTPFGVS